MLRKLLVIAAIAVVFLGVQAVSARADLVTNGTFQTDASGNFTGWTISDPNNTWAISGTPGTTYPGSSASEITLATNFLGTTPNTPESISQTLATTVGQSYTVTFWLANDDYSATSYFKALWNGTVENLTLVSSNGALPNSTLSNAFDYNEFSFTGIATSASTTLAFNFLNDNAIYHLTDVSGQASVPIPAAAWLLGSGLLGLIGFKRKISA